MIRVDEKYLNLTATLCKEVKDASYEVSEITIENDFEWNILEIGCGMGVDVLKMASMLPKSVVLGIDFDKKIIESSKKKLIKSGLNNASFLHKDIYELEDKEVYEFIRIERVLQHLPNIYKAFDVISKALKPSGRLTLVDTNWSKLECAVFSDRANQLVQEIYTEQLINKINREFLEEQFLRVGINDITTKLINVGLSKNDYLNASCFQDLIVPKLSPTLAQEMLYNLNQLKKMDRCGRIEMIVITGTKSKR